MTIEEYRNHCLSKNGVTETVPFPSLPDVLVFKVFGKMFTATDMSTFASIRIRFPREEADYRRERYKAVQKPSFMSSVHWNRVVMDGSLPDDLIFRWIDESYDLVVSKLTKKLRMELKVQATI